MAASHEARIFNTKGHKERLRGMYRNTKYFYGFPTGYGRCVRPRGAGGKAAHRAEARRRDGDIAPYRNGARVVRTTGCGGEGLRW